MIRSLERVRTAVGGKSSLRIVLAVALLALAAVVPAGARADSMTFTFNNATEYQVNLKYYARDRNHHWPGVGKAYVMSAGSKGNQYTIGCNDNERVCYGAWIPYRDVWGAGRSGIRPCEYCCFVCKDGSTLRAVTFKPFISR